MYRISCEECAGRGISSEYIGESSRTGFLRGNEHLDDLKNRKQKSPLWKHCTEEHGGKEVNFSMKIVRSHRTPLTRQIHESVEIEHSSAKILMNSKSEYNGSRIPRIVIEVGDRIETDDWQGHRGESKEGSRLKGKWTSNNLKKRKRNVEEDDKNEHPECGPAEQSEYNKRRKVMPEPDSKNQCVENSQPPPKDGLSVEMTKIPECGHAQLSNTGDDEVLCHALDKVEICYEIVTELINRIEQSCFHTQPKPRQSTKRKLSERQPSVQPRRRRRKETESGEGKDGVAEGSSRVMNVKVNSQEVKTWWKSKLNSKTMNTSKIEENSIFEVKKIAPAPIKCKENNTKGETKPRRKRKIKIPTQRTKITKFYEPIQTRKPGLVAGSWSWLAAKQLKSN